MELYERGDQSSPEQRASYGKELRWLAASLGVSLFVSTELVTNHPETAIEWVSSFIELSVLGAVVGTAIRYAHASFKEAVKESTKAQV